MGGCTKRESGLPVGPGESAGAYTTYARLLAYAVSDEDAFRAWREGCTGYALFFLHAAQVSINLIHTDPKARAVARRLACFTGEAAAAKQSVSHAPSRVPRVRF